MVDTIQNLRLASGGDRRIWATGGSWVSGLQFKEISRREREREREREIIHIGSFRFLVFIFYSF